MLKLLTTMAAAIRAPVCPSKGLLVGVNSYAAMASTLKARKSNQRMIAGYLSQLKAVVTLAKLSIKYESSLALHRVQTLMKHDMCKRCVLLRTCIIHVKLSLSIVWMKAVATNIVPPPPPPPVCIIRAFMFMLWKVKLSRYSSIFKYVLPYPSASLSGRHCIIITWGVHVWSFDLCLSRAARGQVWEAAARHHYQ